MGHAYPAGVSRRGVEVELEAVTGLDLDAPAHELAQPELGPLQVAQHAERAVDQHLGGAHVREGRSVIVVAPVTEVQAEDVGPGARQRLDALNAPGRRPKRADHARAARADHCGARTVYCF